MTFLNSSAPKTSTACSPSSTRFTTAGGLSPRWAGTSSVKTIKAVITPATWALNKPGAVDAVTYLKKFYADDVFPAGIIGDNGLNAIDSLFTEKKAAAVINGPWAFQPYEAAGINYGVAPLPTLPDGKPMSSFLGVKGYVVSTWSKDKAMAQKFIEFINQPQYVKTALYRDA